LVERVLQLLKANQPEANILRVVQAYRRSQDLSAEDRSRLEAAGASENLIERIANVGKASPAPNARAVQAAPAQANKSDDAKGKACQEEAKLYFPNDAVAEAKAVLTCMDVPPSNATR
jgi:hypothetical protein